MVDNVCDTVKNQLELADATAVCGFSMFLDLGMNWISICTPWRGGSNCLPLQMVIGKKTKAMLVRKCVGLASRGSLPSCFIKNKTYHLLEFGKVKSDQEREQTLCQDQYWCRSLPRRWTGLEFCGNRCSVLACLIWIL